MDKRSVVLYCILSNLLAGNGIVFLWSLWGGGINGINWDLMIGMTLSCILCYLLVFKYIKFKKWNFLTVLILSVLTCVVIVLVGCAFASVVTGIRLEKGYGLYAIFKGLGVGFILGILGNILMFPITITMGAANLFWFRKYQQIVE